MDFIDKIFTKYHLSLFVNCLSIAHCIAVTWLAEIFRSPFSMIVWKFFAQVNCHWIRR